METEWLIPIALFAMVFGIVYIAIRSKERKALIAKGLDASLLETKKRVPADLKWGMLFVGIGVGVLLGRLFASYTCMGEEASYFSMICLFGGLSLVIYHFIARANEKKEKSGQ
jgi:preprotein translocase subunit YajC